MSEKPSLRSADGTSSTPDGSSDRGSSADYSSADPLPGPRGLPIVGSTLSIARDPFGFLESAREYGDVVGYRAYGTDFALVFDPHVVETVLVSRADAFRKGEFETEFGDLIAPEGILFTEGDRWRRQRQLLQSSFTPERIRSYADGMVAETATVVADWDDGETISLRDALSTCTVRILARTLFDLREEPRSSTTASGVSPRAFAADRVTTVTRAANAVNVYASPRRLAIGAILPSWVPDRVEREYEDAMADLTALVDDLVAQRRDATGETDAPGDDLLSVLARAESPDGSRIPPAEIRDHLVSFLFAGHETTATALACACWLLAGNSRARTELERELEAVCGDRDPTVADLDGLAYTEAVVREALRLYPSVTGVYREPTADVVLGGYRVPAGTTLQLSIYGIQRDGRWWDDPGAFRPERWLVDGDGGRHRLADDPDRPEYAYFPFGGGPRHCLGMRFAMLELQLALATIVRRVEFDRSSESLEPSLGVTLDPGPLDVRVRRR